ncbi:MAG: alpha-amylase family glycosyl hydrolase [Planctomycetota bacterium]
MRNLCAPFLGLVLCLAMGGVAFADGFAETRDRIIYEVNLRQHTEAGTFDAFREHLPRLHDMGVGVLWLMPIHPIGEENRKGTLGSYYAATDYKDVNPEFGTRRDFKELVEAAHELGMLVVLDWVPNHTAWDHEWTRSHPERYAKGPDGGFRPPNDDWVDVIQLDYSNSDTRAAMLDAMLYWVREFEVDGFRADVAEMIPKDFWIAAIERLRRERDMFMLAEGGAPWLHEAGFEATYGWGLGDRLMRVYAGENDAADVRRFLIEDTAAITAADDSAFRMFFTTNHDWNTWNGLAIERLGEMWEAATVLTFTAPGMPMIYNGQEAGLDKRLEFFEKDPIEWRADSSADLYRRLAQLKKDEPALHHGESGGTIVHINTNDPDRLLAFRRVAEGSEIIVLANLSGEPVEVRGVRTEPDARYADLYGYPTEVPERLDAWGWHLLVRR